MQTTTTTTPLPTIIPDREAGPLNVFERYPYLVAFLNRFAPWSLQIDKAATAIYLPIGFLGLTVAATVLFSWAAQHDFKRPGTTYIYQQYRERKRGKLILRLLGLVCFLLLIQCGLLLVLDLDEPWDLKVLTFVRSTCPLLHTFDTANRAATALTIVLIGWHGYTISKPFQAGRQASRRHRLCGNLVVSCKRMFGILPAATAVFLLSLAAGLVGINYWQVTDIEVTQPAHSLQLRCTPAGGYQSGFQFHANATLLFYQWAVNVAIFCPSCLTCIVWALVLWRRLLTNQNSLEMGARVGCVWSQRVVHRVQLVASVCGLYGLANLPIVATRLLTLMATPGAADLPDREIERDPSWQRMLQHTLATTICRELADAFTTALLLPVLLLSCRAFRRRFLQLLRLDGTASTLSLSRRIRLPSLKRLLWGESRKPRALEPLSPRWSWGKGWRRSYSVPIYAEQPDPVEDPDVLDAIVEQHNNAYAAEDDQISHAQKQRYVKHAVASSSRRWNSNRRLPSDMDFL
uniref:G_PROTEIN_RECEP_F1_2 domain-containing protein n=1 Tax=Mesocestoides corti TaxID=53468 RepID=A0A5K3FCJ2_MESCO